ncbi:MAG: hypothetical protein KKF12_12655 [Proteobacteria bacterium]|nr:hypothetical protein [Desulfobacula sp.]MBU3953532.1 hypothetical protein [Pseudomonadota bacterium]MBU4131663.1 hypothetical protein [Pseudomonadota bacterium]
MTLPESKTQTTPQDEQIANQAFGAIYKIVSTHYGNALLEVGNYLVKTFYENDYDRARQQNPAQKAAFSSLNALIVEKRKHTPDVPSKSWIYNAVALACDAHFLAEFAPYDAISISHKAQLLPVRDMEQKKAFISQIATQQMTVKQARALISGDDQIEFTVHNLPPAKELIYFPPMLLASLKADAKKEIARHKTKVKKYQTALNDIQQALDDNSHLPPPDFQRR